MGKTREYYTLWVCSNCMFHHANGECGDCHSDSGHEYEPLNNADYRNLSMGLMTDEHSEDCDVRIRGEWPDNYECDCETNTFSTSSCDGCGSHYHGERHAMTEWSE